MCVRKERTNEGKDSVTSEGKKKKKPAVGGIEEGKTRQGRKREGRRKF